MTATCIVRRWLLGNEQLSVQFYRGRNTTMYLARGELRAAVTVCCAALFTLCLLTAWLLFKAGARAARGKGNRRGLRL